MGFRSYIRQSRRSSSSSSRKQEEKVATIIFSIGFTRVAGAGAAAAGENKRKKKLKSSFSMGFRSYIRQFLGAILMLFRPSLPWGFAAGSGSILGVAACHRSSRSRSSRKQEEKVATIIFFYRFQKSSCSRSSSSSKRKQEEKVAKIIFFYRFQKLH